MSNRRGFTIFKKLALGFGITIFAIIIGSYYTYSTLKKNIETISCIANVDAPSEQHLHDMYFLISNSKMLIKNWVFIEVKDNTPNKKALIQLHHNQFPAIKEKLSPLIKYWSSEEQIVYNTIINKIEDSLFVKHKYIMNNLKHFEDYDRPMILIEAMSMVEEDNDDVMALSNRILKDLNILINKISEKFKKGKEKIEASNTRFKKTVFVIGLSLMILSIIVGLILARLIIKPINKLKKATQEISRGNLDVYVSLNSNDEIFAKKVRES